MLSTLVMGMMAVWAIMQVIGFIVIMLTKGPNDPK